MNYFLKRSIVLGLLILTAAPAVAKTDQEIIDAIQSKYDTTKTFKARFVQKSYLKVMDQTQVAKGEVIIKKPGKMKWDYNAPDPQVLVSNNKSLWLYLPEESQVTRMQVDSIYSSNTPALFLSGQGKLTESFNIGKITREEGNVVVELLPKKEDQGLKKLVLYADQNTFQIVGSKVYDKLGNQTEMMFKQIEDNPGISDSKFQFDVPPGVELIDLSEQP